MSSLVKSAQISSKAISTELYQPVRLLHQYHILVYAVKPRCNFCLGSVYEPIEEAFQAHVRRTPSMQFRQTFSSLSDANIHPETITPDQYAAGVVNEAVKKSPPVWFWHGAQTTSVRLLDALFPRTIWVCNVAFVMDRALRHGLLTCRFSR